MDNCGSSIDSDKGKGERGQGIKVWDPSGSSSFSHINLWDPGQSTGF